jgi:hypothetical protein
MPLEMVTWKVAAATGRNHPNPAGMISSIQRQQICAHARLNRQHMAPGVACGCLYCLRSFPAEEITRWADAATTAHCPHCGVDSVLSSSIDPLSDTLIEQLHGAYFESSRKYTDEEWRRDPTEQQRRQRSTVAGAP